MGRSCDGKIGSSHAKYGPKAGEISAEWLQRKHGLLWDYDSAGENARRNSQPSQQFYALGCVRRTHWLTLLRTNSGAKRAPQIVRNCVIRSCNEVPEQFRIWGAGILCPEAAFIGRQFPNYGPSNCGQLRGCVSGAYNFYRDRWESQGSDIFMLLSKILWGLVGPNVILTFSESARLAKQRRQQQIFGHKTEVCDLEIQTGDRKNQNTTDINAIIPDFFSLSNVNTFFSLQNIFDWQANWQGKSVNTQF